MHLLSRCSYSGLNFSETLSTILSFYFLVSIWQLTLSFPETLFKPWGSHLQCWGILSLTVWHVTSSSVGLGKCRGTPDWLSQIEENRYSMKQTAPPPVPLGQPESLAEAFSQVGVQDEQGGACSTEVNSAEWEQLWL